MRMHTFATALPTRLAALAALGLLITACGNEPAEVDAPAPGAGAPEETETDTDDEDTEGTDGGDAAVELVIETSVSSEEGLTPEEGFEEGTWTLTCAPVGGDHPDPEAACADIDAVGTEPFTMDTTDMMCTMEIGGPEEARVTGHVEDTEIDTEFNKRNGCEIERFAEVEAVINP
ncbi:SSI family serine proteinase inhibitor [Nocardiopsis sp. MG754419]|uniref:SSI family serine proteinase inhibitor n=1 Tax=Nocardiopsis sp. MG754419 TaxID=2259865 RepID=UPI001BAB2FF6|nr:SSI family serine proteinase inhibitor [Nocardiopsis sp. MG754419]MBR8742257.1 proteinase inhibitor I4 serpin [Nocardiopsis sp. MG754419]